MFKLLLTDEERAGSGGGDHPRLGGPHHGVQIEPVHVAAFAAAGHDAT